MKPGGRAADVVVGIAGRLARDREAMDLVIRLVELLARRRGRRPRKSRSVRLK